MGSTSAGIVPYRFVRGTGAHTGTERLEVFLGHMGGPFWARKDVGAWTIVKGEFDAATEDPVVAARREFAEETGVPCPVGELMPLGTAGNKRKVVTAYGIEVTGELEFAHSNTFELEWPPRSGRIQAFPELDRAGWLSLDEAREKVVGSQRPLLDRLETVAFRRDISPGPATPG